MSSKLKLYFKDLFRAFSLVWKTDKTIGSINILLQAAQALLPIIALYYLKQIIEALGYTHSSFNGILIPIVIYGIIQVCIAGIGQYSSFISTKHQYKLTDNLSGEVLEKAVVVDYAYYENPAYHDTLHLAQQQAIFKATQLLNNLNGLLLNILSLAFLVGFFLTLHSSFALLFVLLSVPLALIKWYSGFKLLQLDRKFAPLEREANYLHQTLTSTNAAKEVRVFGYGTYFIQKFKAIRALIQKDKTKLNATLTIYSLIAEVGEIIVMILVFSLLAKYTWQRAITVGAFVIYIQGFQRLQSSSKNFLQALVQILQQRIFLNDLFTFLDLSTHETSTGNQPFPEGTDGLQVEGLSFTYPDTSKVVLNNISFSCKPGQIIAIVGENGSGKSTLVKLLARLFHPPAGTIRIDNKFITDIDINTFRNNTVFLFQDFEKYYITVNENITLGSSNEAQQAPAIEQAAKLSDAHNFIMKLNQGYQTRIGRVFRGSEQLSGGQWQKLALARAFYKKARLVILDEPTSALDPVAEFEVFENVKKQFKDQMVVLITHRLYNLKIADHIFVLKNGQVEQHGDFESLIQTEGEFKKMYDNQKL